MRVVVFAPYAQWQLFETDLELIQRHVDAGDSVTVLGCHGEMRGCDHNPRAMPHRCVSCQGRGEFGLKVVRGEFNVRSFACLTDRQQRELDELQLRFSSTSELVDCYVENFDIGWAVLSSLISRHRDAELDLTAVASELDLQFRGAWMVYYSLRNLLQREAVDRVYVFNGRYAPLRAAFRACQAENVDCYLHDVGKDFRHFALYRNALPHDHRQIAECIEQTWEDAATNPHREQIASQWFNDRAHGIVRSGKNFVRRQRPDLLPASWREDARSVVIFTSSEDEFAAIGDTWRNPLYESQTQGLVRIVESLQSMRHDLQLYIRVHPNLAGLDNQQTRTFQQLASPGVSVLPAEDPVSTYALMRHCEKVLTFGSTAGVEAVFWGKPSVLAGMSFYRELGVACCPTTHNELIDLLLAKLPTPHREPALKYGFYQATIGEPYQHFQPKAWFRGKFRGHRVRPTARSWVRSRMVKWWPNMHSA